MKYIDYFSAHMGLLNKKGGDKSLLGFAEYIFDCVLSKVMPAKRYEKISCDNMVFQHKTINREKIITSISFIQKKMIGGMPDFMVRPYKHHFAGKGK